MRSFFVHYGKQDEMLYSLQGAFVEPSGRTYLLYNVYRGRFAPLEEGVRYAVRVYLKRRAGVWQ